MRNSEDKIKNRRLFYIQFQRCGQAGIKEKKEGNPSWLPSLRTILSHVLWFDFRFFLFSFLGLMFGFLFHGRLLRFNRPFAVYLRRGLV